MRTFAAVVLASTVFVSSAFAAGSDTTAPLAPGKPAGVKEAALAGSGLLILLGIGIVAGGIALVASQGSGNNITTTTTTGTVP